MLAQGVGIRLLSICFLTFTLIYNVRGFFFVFLLFVSVHGGNKHDKEKRQMPLEIQRQTDILEC